MRDIPDFLYLAKCIKKLYKRFGVFNNKISKNLFFHFSFKGRLFNIESVDDIASLEEKISERNTSGSKST